MRNYCWLEQATKFVAKHRNHKDRPDRMEGLKSVIVDFSTDIVTVTLITACPAGVLHFSVCSRGPRGG